MDSSGLAALVSALKATREGGGWVRLANLTAQVQSVFKLTMLDKVFDMFPSVEAAMS